MDIRIKVRMPANTNAARKRRLTPIVLKPSTEYGRRLIAVSDRALLWNFVSSARLLAYEGRERKEDKK